MKQKFKAEDYVRIMETRMECDGYDCIKGDVVKITSIEEDIYYGIIIKNEDKRFRIGTNYGLPMQVKSKKMSNSEARLYAL